MGNDPGGKDLLGHRVFLTVLMSQPGSKRRRNNEEKVVQIFQQRASPQLCTNVGIFYNYT